MSKQKPIDIFIVPIKDIDVKFTYANNIIQYQFTRDGQNYGNALNVLPEGKKRTTIESAIKGGAVLMLNAIESVNGVIEINK